MDTKPNPLPNLAIGDVTGSRQINDLFGGGTVILKGCPQRECTMMCVLEPWVGGNNTRPNLGAWACEVSIQYRHLDDIWGLHA